jgi:hypothetical protein
MFRTVKFRFRKLLVSDRNRNSHPRTCVEARELGHPPSLKWKLSTVHEINFGPALSPLSLLRLLLRWRGPASGSPWKFTYGFMWLEKLHAAKLQSQSTIFKLKRPPPHLLPVSRRYRRWLPTYLHSVVVYRSVQAVQWVCSHTRGHHLPGTVTRRHVITSSLLCYYSQ